MCSTEAHKYKNKTPLHIMIIFDSNEVLLVKVTTWKTAFGKKNVYLERPIYTLAGMSVKIYLQVINVFWEMRITINITA